MDDSSREAAVPEPTDSNPSLVTASVNLLGAALGDPESSIGHVFDSLAQQFADSVDSFVAMTLTITVDDHPFHLTSSRLSDAVVVTTLSVPLVVSESTSCVLVMAASAPHAFMSVAHDAASELGIGAGIEHDGHIDEFAAGAERSGSSLADRSVIDQAIGILIDRGPAETIVAAHATLNTEAAQSGLSVVEVAQRIVDSITDRKTNSDNG